MALNVDILRFLLSLKQQVSPTRDKDGGKRKSKKGRFGSLHVPAIGIHTGSKGVCRMQGCETCMSSVKSSSRHVCDEQGRRISQHPSWLSENSMIPSQQLVGIIDLSLGNNNKWCSTLKCPVHHQRIGMPTSNWSQ